MLNTLVDIARSGGQIAASMKSEAVTKGHHDGLLHELFTDADIAVNNREVTDIGNAFPGIPIVSEEEESHAISSDTFFTIDAIDGTLRFKHGWDDWGTMIGYVESGQPQVGVIYLPERCIMIAAAKGHGCTVNDKRVNLSGPANLAEAAIGMEGGPWTPPSRVEAINALDKHSLARLSAGFVAPAIAQLLLGNISLYPNFKAKIWDFVPSFLAVTEARGVALHPDDGALAWDTEDMQVLFASNQSLADQAIALIKRYTKKNG